MLLIGREGEKGRIGKISGPAPSKLGESRKNREESPKKDKKRRTSPDRETPRFFFHLPSCLIQKLWSDPRLGEAPEHYKLGHTPSTAGTFWKKFRKNSGKTPETLSECFLEFPSRVRLGSPKPYNSRHLRLPEHFLNSLPPSTAGDASFFRSGSGEGLEDLHRFQTGFHQRDVSMRALWSDRQNRPQNASGAFLTDRPATCPCRADVTGVWA